MRAKNNNSSTLYRWQSDLNYAIEAGIAPIIPLGASDSALTALPSLLLLYDLAAQRTDITVPTALAGGSSGAWLAGLFAASDSPGLAVQALQANGTEKHTRVSPSPVVVYSGVDSATHMASAGILPRPPAGLLPLTDRGLPAGIRDMVAPSLQPAAPVTWENAPFRMLEPAESATGLPAASLWMGWLAGALTIIMILGALIA
jgi:hypothetical protein